MTQSPTLVELAAEWTWEGRRRQPRKATPTQLARAYCADSPTLAHRWYVAGSIETCRDCHTSRDNRLAAGLGGPKRLTNPLSPATQKMREGIMALEVGETCVVDHSHLVCRLGPFGGIVKCGLQMTLRTLRDQTLRERDFVYSHDGTPHVATIRRFK